MCKGHRTAERSLCYISHFLNSTVSMEDLYQVLFALFADLKVFMDHCEVMKQSYCSGDPNCGPKVCFRDGGSNQDMGFRL